ncbi:unnamed protein product [Symbiodinium sp. CCMP2592]|nr:unnamed protein product [Symbiodinium sp. CCMP2592]
MDSTTAPAAHTAENIPCNSRIKPTRAPDTEPSVRERWNNRVSGIKGYPTSNPVLFPKGPPPPPGADLLAILQGTDSEVSEEVPLVASASTTAVPRELPQEPDSDFDLDQPVGDGAYQPTWNELVLACLPPPLKAAPTSVALATMAVPPAVEEPDSLPEHPESEPGTPAADPVLDDPMEGTSDEGFMPLLDSDAEFRDLLPVPQCVRSLKRSTRLMVLSVIRLHYLYHQLLLYGCQVFYFQKVKLKDEPRSMWIAMHMFHHQAPDGSTTYRGRRVVLKGHNHLIRVWLFCFERLSAPQDLHSIDIVCGYQFALHQEADNNNLLHRHKYWDRLGALLHNLPQRNLLILAGDMNCTPEFVEGSMGHTYDASAKYPDSGEFAALLEAHGLILLNGWIRRRLQPTFVGAKHKSVIDFVITRRQHADALARRLERGDHGCFNFGKIFKRYHCLSSQAFVASPCTIGECLSERGLHSGNNAPVVPVELGPYTKPSIAAGFSINSAYYDTPDCRPSQLPGCFLIDMDAQSGAEALAQVQDMFPHLAPPTTAGDAPMEGVPLTGRREREEDKAEAAEPQDKYRRPAGKGQNHPTGKSPPRESTQEPASASAGHTKQGRTRQWTDQEWADWQTQNTQAGWNKNKTTKELQKELDALKEDVRLLSRIAMRHEDELSQRRTETDFILTLEVADPKATQEQEGILEQLYKMTVVWKQQQEAGKANNSLRLTLFIGLLLYYEIKVQEATASAESVENLAQQGLLIQVEGNPAWTYRQWDHQQEALIQSSQPPLLDTVLRGHLQTLKTSIGAPAVTFFLSIGLRDPLALVCYRSLQALCYNSSNQLLKMRLKPIRMERQPLVRIIQERYPAPPTRSEEQRATYLAKQMQKGRKGKGKGREARQDPTMPEQQLEDPLTVAAAEFQASRGA